MIKQIFTVYDLKAETYGQPFLAVNRAVAVRDFTAAANDPTTNLNKFPLDYRLCEIGEFDDAQGTIYQYPQMIPVGLAHQYLDSERNYDVRS